MPFSSRFYYSRPCHLRYRLFRLTALCASPFVQEHRKQELDGGQNADSFFPSFPAVVIIIHYAISVFPTMRNNSSRAGVQSLRSFQQHRAPISAIFSARRDLPLSQQTSRDQNTFVSLRLTRSIERSPVSLTRKKKRENRAIPPPVLPQKGRKVVGTPLSGSDGQVPRTRRQ